MYEYENQKLEALDRAKSLLSLMSVEEKMAQTVCYNLNLNDNFASLERDYPFGAGEVGSLSTRGLTSAGDFMRIQKRVQKKIMSMNRFHIPATFHMEGISGAHVTGATSFPSGIGKGSTWNPQLEYKIGRIVGRQERRVGVTRTLAPVLDISRDARLGRYGESYSEDPVLVAEMGTAYTRGVQEDENNGIRTTAVAKHFLASQASNGGIHGTEVQLSNRTLEEVYARPFQAAFNNANLKGIMPCYSGIDQIPTSVSRQLLTTLLKKQMKFQGLVFSDYYAIRNAHTFQKIGETFTDTGWKAMSAGMDIENPEKICFNDELGQAFKNGDKDIKVLDRAVLKILIDKFEMGLFDHPFGQDEEEIVREFSDSHSKETSLRAAEESLVLLKNDGVLPLNKKIRKIIIIGPHANTARSFFGGYSYFSMEEGSLAHNIENNNKRVKRISGTPIQVDNQLFEETFKRKNPKVRSLFEELKLHLNTSEISYCEGYDIAGNDTSAFNIAIEKASGADLVILTLGGKYGTRTVATTAEGVDSTNVNLPEIQDKFIKEISRLNKPLIGIHFDGRPISSDVADDRLDAIIEAWTPGEFGAKALVNTLTGVNNPSGKLPVSVARTSGQIPIHYNHLSGSSFHQAETIGFENYVDMSHKPRYSFGYGLTYSNFEYHKLNLDKNKVDANDSVEIKVEVTNTSHVKGAEVVQLYVTDVYAEIMRPVIELAGFRKILLDVGETKTISFELAASQMAFLDKDMKWKIQAGKIKVYVGRSVDDLRTEGIFEIKNDQYIDGADRQLYANSSIID